MLAVTAAGAVALFWAATAWLQRGVAHTVALDPAGPYRFLADAGPVELTAAPTARLHYDASWFVVGPDVHADGGSPMSVTCRTRFPCRAASRLELPSAAAVEISVTDEPVLVDRFDGDLVAMTAGDADVSLGLVAGTVAIVTEGGDVVGSGLSAETVDVQTASGEVSLRFWARPRSVRVQSDGQPVNIELPDGDYAVSVESGSSVEIDVDQSPMADSHLFVTARGPVRIRQHDDS